MATKVEFQLTPEGQQLQEFLDKPYFEQHGAGIDLRAVRNYSVLPLQTALVATGVKVNVPEHLMGKVWDRSSIALRGFAVRAGVIDPGYQGEIGIVMQNTSLSKVLQIKTGERIAQMVFFPPVFVELISVTEFLDKTLRGVNGFGSTGEV